MSRFVSKQKLLVGVLVISSLGIGYALGARSPAWMPRSRSCKMRALN